MRRTYGSHPATYLLTPLGVRAPGGSSCAESTARGRDKYKRLYVHAPDQGTSGFHMHRINGPAGFVRTPDQWTSGFHACTAISHARPQTSPVGLAISPLPDRAADGVSHAQSTFLIRKGADPAAIMATAAARAAAHNTQSCLSSHVSFLSSHVSSGPLCRLRRAFSSSPLVS